MGTDTPARMTILVVDDDPNLHALLTDVLTGEGYAVQSAYDGLQGLHKASENPPDLILLDLMMPKMDGFALVEALRADPRLRQIPIVVLSAIAHLDQHQAALGAQGVISKPFDLDELLSTLARCLRTRPA